MVLRPRPPPLSTARQVSSKCYVVSRYVVYIHVSVCVEVASCLPSSISAFLQRLHVRMGDSEMKHPPLKTKSLFLLLLLLVSLLLLLSLLLWLVVIFIVVLVVAGVVFVFCVVSMVAAGAVFCFLCCINGCFAGVVYCCSIDSAIAVAVTFCFRCFLFL